MAYKDLKSMFVTYLVPEIKENKTESVSELNIPKFNKWTHVENLIPIVSKPKEETEQKEKSEIQSTYDNQAEYNPWTIEGNTKIARVRKVNNKDGYRQFQSQLDEYFVNNPQDSGYRDMLTNIAAMESSFKQDATNKWSSALGYFQFIDGTRKRYNNMSRNEFANNSQEQIRVAIQHLKDLKADVQRNIDNETIANSGLTPLQIMYGMWWRPKSMYNYLRTGKDNFSTKDGMNIEKILEKAS